MKLAAWAKTTIVLGLMTAAHAVLGLACQTMEVYYPMLFSSRQAVLLSAVWIFAAEFFILVLAGLATAVIRPFRTIVLGFALSALVMNVAWGIDLITILASIVYWLVACGYAWMMTRELKNTIRFSFQTILRQQGLLMFISLAMISTSLAAVYSDRIVEAETYLPPGFQQLATETATGIFKTSDGYLRLGKTGQAIVLQQAEQTLDHIWSSLEALLARISGLLPFAVGALVLLWLDLIASAFAWIPAFALHFLFWFLVKLGFVHAASEAVQAERYGLE